jgi:hypothetical protein
MSDGGYTRTCVFCGKPTKMTSEHIWGDWIKQFIPPSLNKHYLGLKTINVGGKPDTDGVRIRAGDPVNSQVRIVRGDCNSGWMSVLQAKAKKFLPPLLTGERIGLGPAAQQAIAAWITMACMTAEHIIHDPFSIAISQGDRTQLTDTGVPLSNWKIYVGHYRAWKWNTKYLHTCLPILDIAPDPNGHEKPIANTQTSTFVLGNLYVHAMSSEHPEYIEGWRWPIRPSMVLIQIWPPKETFIAWPGMTMVDQDAMIIAEFFFRNIHAIAHRMGF